MYVLPNNHGEETVMVDYTTTEQHTKVPSCSNPILASFVTAYGRIKLYETFKKLVLVLSHIVIQIVRITEKKQMK